MIREFFKQLFQKVYNKETAKAARESSSALASDVQRGGYHLYAHSGKSKTFKKNQRKQRALSAKRKSR